MLRKAKLEDAKKIQALINNFARKNLMLARSLNEIYENLRDFWVYAKNNKILGCCALHFIGWENLAEIKSLAVSKSEQHRGIGTQLISACLDEAKKIGAKKAFVLTYIPGYFKRFGFKKTSHAKLPHKIWAECIYCTKFPNCNEIAMIKDLK